MADDNKQDKDKDKPNEQRPGSLAENAATSYGLEDHEATQQDPRVNELRRAADKTQPKKTESKQEPKTEPKPEPREVSTASTPTTAPTMVATPTGARRNELNSDSITNSSSPPAARSSVETPPPFKHESISSTPAPPPPPPTPKTPAEVQSVPPPPPPLPMPTVVAVPVEEKSKRQPGVNKTTNTDISFDPSKQFACKTTNTTGKMYEDEELEEEHPEPAAPPPIPPQPTALSLDDAFAFAVALVKRAGAFALESNKAKDRLSYTTKEHERDLNTRTDNEVEDMLITEINKKYPSHKIIAEEQVSRSETGQVQLTKEPTWIIDPIDGTMNFVHHFPYYCISLALLVDKSTMFGIVFNPALQEFYSARKGQGALLNDEPILTSGQTQLKNAMVLQEYSTSKDETRAAVAIENTSRLIQTTHALRSIGSSAMGLAMVASGVADAFYFFGLHIWDMTAGNLLVTEAGGVVIDPDGGLLDLMSRRVLAAATLPLAQQLSAQLTQNYPSPRDDESKIAADPDELGDADETGETADPSKKDFTAQTEFSDSSLSLSSSDPSTRR